MANVRNLDIHDLMNLMNFSFLYMIFGMFFLDLFDLNVYLFLRHIFKLGSHCNVLLRIP